MNRRPAYARIAASIKAQWLAGPDVRQGRRLPPERQLQTQFGVSRATISRALASLAAEGLIETRPGSGAYIREAPSPPAAGRRLVGFIAPHIPEPSAMSNPVLLRIYHGIEHRARALGYQVLAASANFSVAHEEALIEQFLQLGAEGILLYPVYFPAPRRHSEAASDYLTRRWRDIPLVLTDIGCEEWGRTLVAFDNCRLGYDLTRALLRHGHRRILFMHTAEDRLQSSIHERQRGWQRAMEQAGAAIPETYRDWPTPRMDFAQTVTEDEADALAADLLRLDPRPDAVIAWEDGTAIRLIQALQRRGVGVPEPIRVAGFDNHAAGQFFQPPFPTSNPDFSHLGEVAVELLDRQIQERWRQPRTFLLPVSVHWRDILPGRPIPVRIPKGGEVPVSP